MRQLLILLCLYLPVQGHCQLQAETLGGCKATLYNSETIFPASAKRSETHTRYTLNRPVLWAGIGAAFASGAAWGLHEKQMHHWGEFKERFPNASPRFWGPDSWRNKYVNQDPAQGRTAWDLGPVQVTKPVFFTDAKHPLATATIGFGFSAGICLGHELRQPRPWWHYALDAALIFGARSAGNYITFNALYH